MSAVAPPTVSPAARPGSALRVTQGRVLLSEFTKFRSLRSTMWTLLTAVVVIIGIGAIFSAVNAGQQHRFTGAGLCQVGGEGRLVFARGGSAGASVHVANLRQVGDHMAAAGLVTGEQVTQAISLLEDPALIWAMPIMITAWGRKGQQTELSHDKGAANRDALPGRDHGGNGR